MTGLGIRRITTEKPTEALAPAAEAEALPLDVTEEPAFRDFSATKHVRNVTKPARVSAAGAESWDDFIRWVPAYLDGITGIDASAVSSVE